MRTNNLMLLNTLIPSKVLIEIPSIKELNSSMRLAHFLSQCSVESLNFTRTEENLNYSTDGLLSVFPSYFTSATAIQYEHSPQQIANRVYANRMGNGDELSNDGWEFRGRGYIQITGRYMYRMLSSYLGEDIITNPDLVASKYPLTSVGVFFTYNRLWEICDRGQSEDTIKVLTRRINGGVNGLDERIRLFKKFAIILGI